MQIKRRCRFYRLIVCILLLAGILSECAGTAISALAADAESQETSAVSEEVSGSSQSFPEAGPYPSVSWTQKDDGSYSITMEDFGKNSKYAWYVLDADNKALSKTRYTKNNSFICDLSDENIKTIKCYIRTYTGKQYKQTSYSIGRSEVLSPLLPVASTQVSAEAKEALWELVFEDTFYIDQIMTGEYRGVSITLPMDWACQDVESRSLAVQLNSFRFLSSVFSAWKATHDPQFADILQDYTMDWIAQNTVIPTKDPVIWHDDATARRVHRMALIYDEFKESFTEEERQQIADSLEQQARLLLNPFFYTENHNHGMYQDLGVIAYALLVCEDEQEKQEMLSAASGRTLTYVSSVYTQDGVHKEHSPRYAVYVADVVSGLQKILQENVPRFSKETGALMAKAVSFIVQCVQPDGILASVGDETKRDLFTFPESLFEGSPEAEYINSHGSNGSRPADRAVYPEGGYAFFRSSWDDAPEEASWLMFLAASHSSTHKHGDDLSFLLYHKGELFVEAGSRDYNYDNAYTSWAYSGYAHNVLLVDRKAFPVNVGKSGWQTILPAALNTHITDYDISDPELCSVSGSCERFSDVLWQRSLEYNRADDIVVIRDELQAKKQNRTATLLFHIAEGVDVTETENGWLLSRDGTPVAEVEIRSSGKAPTLRTYTGEGKNPFSTWIFNRKTEPAYGTVLTVELPLKPKNAQITTEIRLL